MNKLPWEFKRFSFYPQNVSDVFQLSAAFILEATQMFAKAKHQHQQTWQPARKPHRTRAGDGPTYWPGRVKLVAIIFKLL